MHIRMMREKEFENTFVAVSSTLPFRNASVEKTKIMASLRTKIPHIASIRDERYGESVSFCFCPLLYDEKTFVSPIRLHPRISVVKNVAKACTANGESRNLWNISAPKLPSMYPRMFTTMMLAAVNSTLRPFFRQISRAIVIVSIVSRSSSSKPAARHPKATAA